MPLRRRNTLPPFEVMGQANSRQGATRPAAPAKPASAPEPAVMSRAPMDRPPEAASQGWWGSAQEPVRVPRVLFAGLAVVVVILLVIAYWVGRDVGRRLNMVAQQNTDMASEQRLAMNPQMPPPQRTADSGFTGSGPRSGDAAFLKPAPALPAGPGANSPVLAARQPGLNYIVLATFSKTGVAEAQRLVQFLNANGVEGGVVLGHNGRSFQVLAMRGFTREQLASAAYQEFEETLLGLGRLWKAKYKGETNFLDMYPQRYTGDAGARSTPPTGNTR